MTMYKNKPTDKSKLPVDPHAVAKKKIEVLESKVAMLNEQIIRLSHAINRKR